MLAVKDLGPRHGDPRQGSLWSPTTPRQQTLEMASAMTAALRRDSQTESQGGHVLLDRPRLLLRQQVFMHAADLRLGGLGAQL